MNIFEFRNQLIGDYAAYIQSFIQIRDPQIRDFVQQKLVEGCGGYMGYPPSKLKVYLFSYLVL